MYSMRLPRSWIILFLCLVANGTEAMFVAPDLETVPIGRVLTNLARLYKDNPSNSVWLYSLARVHSMAYATNLTEIVWDKRDHTPYYGYGSDTGIPRFVMVPSKAHNFPDYRALLRIAF